MTALLLSLVLSAAAADRLTYATLDSAAEQRALPYGVYTPPGWDGVTPLPLVVFLHGGGDDVRAFDRHPAAWRKLDRWIEDGRLPPFVMVVPEGERGFWHDWADGTHRYGTWVTEEVIPRVYADLPLVAPEDGGLHLMGISMGGAGTLQLGLGHLDRFASLTVLSAPLFTAEQAVAFLDRGASPFGDALVRIFGEPDVAKVREHNAYALLTDPGALGTTRLVVGHGTADMPGIGRSNKAFRAHLQAEGVPHTGLVFAGGHLWSSWANAYPVALCLQLGGRDCGAGAPGVRLASDGSSPPSDGSVVRRATPSR